MRAPLLLLALILAAFPAFPAQAQRDLAVEAQKLLDGGQPDKVVELLAKQSTKKPEDGRLLLLRSTAHLMLGDVEAGKKDLNQALTLDPTLRQGWLNRAALALAEKSYDAALEAFQTAERLDPQAADNHLNLGAALLLKGDLAAAGERFERYLREAGANAQGSYLVATNFAMAGYSNQASAHLERAIRQDERMRVVARGDANFDAMADQPAFRRLMDVEPAMPPAEAYVERRNFSAAYAAGKSDLLDAVLSALQLAGDRFDPRVEVTERWALVWGELRIVVRNTAEGEGQVELSALPERMPLSTWRAESEDLFRRIQTQVVRNAKKLRGNSNPS